MVGDSVNFNCTSDTQIRFWYKLVSNNPILITNATENRFYIYNTQLSANLYQSILNIDSLIEADFVYYECFDSKFSYTGRNFTKKGKISIVKTLIYVRLYA